MGRSNARRTRLIARDSTPVAAHGESVRRDRLHEISRRTGTLSRSISRRHFQLHQFHAVSNVANLDCAPRRGNRASADTRLNFRPLEEAMRRELTVAQRLALGFGLLLVLFLLISAFAWRALQQSDAAMKSVYEDRTVPMGQLGDALPPEIRSR